MLPRLLCWSVLAVAASAQPVKVYSELQRLDPSGEVIATDKAARPREILSPALARGAWASFNVVVRPPEGKPYWIFVAQNPEDAVKVALHRVIFERHGGARIPDRLEPLQLNDVGRLPEMEPQATGQETIVLWMDLWVARDAPVRRTRLEIQLNSGDDWVIYPMELRTVSAVIPAEAMAGPLEPLGRPDAPASESAAAVLRAYVCGPSAEAGRQAPLTIRAAIRRNARQDMALARSLEGAGGRSRLVADLMDAAGLDSAAAFCKHGPPADERGAEWYLRVRDYLYRLASGPVPVQTGSPQITVRPIR